MPRSLRIPSACLVAWLALAGLAPLAAASIPEPRPEGQLEDGWVNHYQIGVGLRQLDDEAWAGLDELLAIDLDADLRPVSWPVAVSLGLHSGWGNATDSGGQDFDMRLFEFAVGLRRWQDLGPLAVHLGAAGTLSTVRLEGDRFDDNHTAWGGAADAGLFYVHRDAWTFGLRGRYALTEQVDFFLAEDDADLEGWTLVGVFGGRF